MKKNRDSLRYSDFLIINIPAFSFLLLVPSGFLLSFILKRSPVFLGPLFAVWGISGASLLLKDYFDRKRHSYNRLLRLMMNRESLPMDEYLRSTFCGLCIVWALKVRIKNNRKEIGNERKI